MQQNDQKDKLPGKRGKRRNIINCVTLIVKGKHFSCHREEELFLGLEAGKMVQKSGVATLHVGTPGSILNR